MSADLLTATKKEEFRVLVVDDNDTDREIAARYLKKAWPFELELALDGVEDGEEAVAKAKAFPYALILLDWRMPRYNGGDVLRALRAHKVTTPVVVLTSLPQSEIPEDLRHLGAVYLNKDDLTPSTLRSVIGSTSELPGG